MATATEPAGAPGVSSAPSRPAPVTPSAPSRVAPIAAVFAALLVVWYLAAIWLNAPQILERTLGGRSDWTITQLVGLTWSMERPVLPAPHQVAIDLFEAVFTQSVFSPRSLLFHAAVTSGATLLGFAMGTVLGVVLAVLIVHSRTLDRGLLPWIIASQTVPILAIAPIVIVIMGNLGLSGLLPKALISMYLCFFPITVGMVQGLRSPGRIELELMRTYAATRPQLFWKLRLAASLPYLLPSMRVAISAGLVGAIVAELPTGAQAGLGARLLTGSYYGNTLQIWSALIMASLLGLALTGAVTLAEQVVLSRGRRQR